MENKATKTFPEIQRIEFWAATIIYGFSILMLLSDALRGGEYLGPYAGRFRAGQLEFSWFSHYLMPTLIRSTVLYSAALILILQIMRLPLQKEKVLPKVLAMAGIYLLLSLTIGISDTWLKAYLFARYNEPGEVYEYLFRQAFIYALWLIAIFIMYTALKHVGFYLISNSEKLQTRYQLITREGLIASILWLLLLFLSLVSNVDPILLSIAAIIPPFAIVLYWLSLHTLIPQVIKKRRPLMQFFGRVVLILLFSAFPIGIIAMLIFNDGDNSGVVLIFNAIFQLVLTVPLSWYVYSARNKRSDEIVELRTALGKSSASIDSLRSQINPHFLFNALNSLYGISLQEKAERTSEGIQLLGDMMRFMLEENMQDKITLAREIDYIRNFIQLQKLRTESSAEIRIDTTLDETPNALKISPMLLIPFIENAFKHGISLQSPSHVKVSLQISGNNLYFDVYNSIHRDQQQLVSPQQSNIGLSNVRKRLEYLYPKKHELIIRENASEYFVHLTIQLG